MNMFKCVACGKATSNNNHVCQECLELYAKVATVQRVLDGTESAQQEAFEREFWDDEYRYGSESNY